MEEIKTEIIKGVIAFFLILNIITLAFGYYLVDNKITQNNNDYELLISNINRKEENLLENINIVNKSKEDIYGNLKELEINITSLKTKINDSTQEFTSISDQTQYYADKLNLVQDKNAQLSNQKINLQNQITTKQQQAAALQQAKAITTKKTTRTTRSS